MVKIKGVGRPGVCTYECKEKAHGATFLVGGIVLLVAYIMGFFLHMIPLPRPLKRITSWLHRVLVELPVIALVVAFSLILIRMGWSILTAPTVRSLDEQEESLRRSPGFR